MLLRSGYYYQSEEYMIQIDFDAASRAWRENKISVGNGCFVYK
jgi:hypothetical protein